MTRTKRSTTRIMAMAAAPAALLAFPLAFTASTASAQSSGSATYMATLNPLNHATGSGTLMLQLNGDQAVITEHVQGLATTFMGAAYPHVQHIHIGAAGTCPGASADTNGDGVVSTTEGASFYGGIGTTLSVSGDTSPAAGTDVKIAPSGGSFDYSRTITLDAATVSSIDAGKAVIVVHGLDPATLSAQAQGEPSDLVPSLPLAATSPALCGPLQVSQMSSVPGGGVNTGGGGTSGLQEPWMFAASAGLAATAGGALYLRRRNAVQK
ncbi:hypothetical protein KGQ19_35075 [Catenulispora sp. NL8]|uniref:CHRD domain-containing protein n=1 Tax=Catenulispora pinistramenti TaxID=2705254 RepID=A0ABS5L1B2_9ACTN|nr:hypothetical protein [Catenulispora pinistramenti]MBS2552098.1 hypothetical protein [Catenulispora pinistramenti]